VVAGGPPGAGRLLAAAALCVVSLGLAWGAGDHAPGYRADARAVLVPAAVALAVAARRRTAGTRRTARVALAALCALAVLAVSRALPAAAASALGAAALGTPRVWPEAAARAGAAWRGALSR